MVDWARAAGFEVVAAGKGTKYLPAYHQSTPDTVWGHYGFTPEMVANGDFNAQMFNSFLDGTKSAIEMAAVANATGLSPAPAGLAFPPCGVDDLPRVLRPRSAGRTVCTTPARSRSSRAWNGTAVRYSAIYAGASTSRLRPTTNTCGGAFTNTAS